MSQAPPASQLPAPVPDSLDTEVGGDADCGFIKTMAHPDGSALIREFLRRDAAGENLGSNPWFDGATDCPAHEPGPDTYTLIASYSPVITVVNDSLIRAIVTSHRIGHSGSDGAYHATLQIDTGTVIDTVSVRKTVYGWRIVSPALRQFVLYSAPEPQAALRAFKDTLAKLGFR